MFKPQNYPNHLDIWKPSGCHRPISSFGEELINSLMDCYQVQKSYSGNDFDDTCKIWLFIHKCLIGKTKYMNRNQNNNQKNLFLSYLQLQLNSTQKNERLLTIDFYLSIYNPTKEIPIVSKKLLSDSVMMIQLFLF